MKHLPAIVMIAALTFTSCIRDREWDSEPTITSEYKPVLMTKEKLRNSIAFEGARNMNQPGKIYFKGDYIFISERYKGVHIINNSNPESPEKIGFIRVPGCLDMAVKGNTLYVDNAVDLVAIDISDVNAPKVVSRVEDVLPEILTPDGGVLESKYNKEARPENTVVVDWEKI